MRCALHILRSVGRLLAQPSHVEPVRPKRSFGSAAMRHTDARGVMIYRCNRFQIIAPTKPKMYPITPVITISVTAASGSNGLTK